MNRPDMPWGRCDGSGPHDEATGTGVPCGAKHVADGFTEEEENESHRCRSCGVYTPGALVDDGGLCPICVKGGMYMLPCPTCGTWTVDRGDPARRACPQCHEELLAAQEGGINVWLCPLCGSWTEDGGGPDGRWCLECSAATN